MKIGQGQKDKKSKSQKGNCSKLQLLRAHI
jgi:hypothetical protein